MENYSKAALLKFLESSIEKGWVNANTGGGMKAACGKILELIGDAEDVRNVDVQAAVKQYNNRHPSELSSDSLRVYESRVKKALEAFISSVSEPTKLKWDNKQPNGAAPKKLAAKKKDADSEPSSVASLAGAPSGVIKTSSSLGTPMTTSLTIPYPLRNDFVAQVVIPIGMTPIEARNLAKFIEALAPKPEEGQKS